MCRRPTDEYSRPLRSIPRTVSAGAAEHRHDHPERCAEGGRSPPVEERADLAVHAARDDEQGTRRAART